MILSPKQVKSIIYGLAIILILFAGWSIYTSVDYGKKKVEFMEDKVEREGRIKTLTIEKAEAKTEARLSAKAAKVVAKERDLVLAELEKERKKHVIKVEKIEKMEPDEVVRVTQLLLEMGLEDIYRNPEGVQFSLAAAKRCVLELTYLDFYLDIIGYAQYDAFILYIKNGPVNAANGNDFVILLKRLYQLLMFQLFLLLWFNYKQIKYKED